MCSCKSPVQAPKRVLRCAQVPSISLRGDIETVHLRTSGLRHTGVAVYWGGVEGGGTDIHAFQVEAELARLALEAEERSALQTAGEGGAVGVAVSEAVHAVRAVPAFQYAGGIGLFPECGGAYRTCGSAEGLIGVVHFCGLKKRLYGSRGQS